MGVMRQYYGFRGALWELFICFVLGTALAYQIRRHPQPLSPQLRAALRTPHKSCGCSKRRRKTAQLSHLSRPHPPLSRTPQARRPDPAARRNRRRQPRARTKIQLGSAHRPQGLVRGAAQRGAHFPLLQAPLDWGGGSVAYVSSLLGALSSLPHSQASAFGQPQGTPGTGLAPVAPHA